MFSKSMRAKLAVVLSAVAASLILLGCGGGSEPAFSDRPTASFLSSEDLTVTAGKSTALAVQLDRLARTTTFIRLLSVESSPGSFIVPDAVAISAGQRVASFAVTAARGPASVTIQILPDPAYDVTTPSTITISTASTASALLSLVGPDVFVQPGESFFYNVQRNQCGTSATVPLIATGDVNCFSVPDSVTLAAGACTAAFSGVAAQCDIGSIDISILPPTGYALDSDIGTIVLNSASASVESSTDRALGEGGTVRVTIAN